MAESSGQPGIANLSRRRLLQLAAAGTVLGGLAFWGPRQSKSLEAVRHSQPMMGTIVMTVLVPLVAGMVLHRLLRRRIAVAEQVAEA